MGLSQCFGSSAASLKESPCFFKRFPDSLKELPRFLKRFLDSLKESPRFLKRFPDSLKEFLSALKELRARSRPQQMARAGGLRPFRPGKRFKEVLARLDAAEKALAALV